MGIRFEVYVKNVHDTRERSLMMSDFRGRWGFEMTPKNRTLEGKNRTLGEMGGQKLSKIVGHHL